MGSCDFQYNLLVLICFCCALYNMQHIAQTLGRFFDSHIATVRNLVQPVNTALVSFV